MWSSCARSMTRSPGTARRSLVTVSRMASPISPFPHDKSLKGSTATVGTRMRRTLISASYTDAYSPRFLAALVERLQIFCTRSRRRLMWRSAVDAADAPALARPPEKESDLLAGEVSDGEKHIGRLAPRRQLAGLVANVAWRKHANFAQGAVPRRLRSDHLAVEPFERGRVESDHFALCCKRQCTPASQPRLVAAQVRGEPCLRDNACVALIALSTFPQLRPDFG